MTRLVATFLLAAIALPVSAQGVEGALAALRDAHARLEAAETSREERRELGRTIRAYERALQALGTEVDRIAAAARARERAAETQAEDLRRLLSGVARLSLRAEPTVATGTAPVDATIRAGLVLNGLSARVASRRNTLLEERAALKALETELSTLNTAMRDTWDALLEARTDLIAAAADARADKSELPNISEDASNLAALAIALQTLDIGTADTMTLQPGSLGWPIDGTIARPFGAQDANGIPRPGIALAGRPGSLVTAPAQASVRYTGRLDGYGPVIVLEPAPETLLVLSGFETIVAQGGETVDEGAALGFLPGAGSHEEFSDAKGEGSGLPLTKTLYMELRHNRQPVNPLPWFAER